MKKRYIQNPNPPYNLIPAEEYYRPVDVNAPMVMADIQPYQSMIDGTMITSRSQHRAHLKQHGCFEIGNEIKALHAQAKPLAPPPGLKERLIQVVNQKGY